MIGDEGAESLAAVLGQSASIVDLDLNGNWITPEGAGRLLAVMPQCKSLAHLNLYWNMIDDGCVHILAGVMSQCQSLTCLNLTSWKKIGEEGRQRLRALAKQYLQTKFIY